MACEASLEGTKGFLLSGLDTVPLGGEARGEFLNKSHLILS
jgi:hypothetical protein